MLARSALYLAGVHLPSILRQQALSLHPLPVPGWVALTAENECCGAASLLLLGPTLTIMKGVGKPNIFGGFTDLHWDSTSTYKEVHSTSLHYLCLSGCAVCVSPAVARRRLNRTGYCGEPRWSCLTLDAIRSAPLVTLSYELRRS
jgi:hypothetical protein